MCIRDRAETVIINSGDGLKTLGAVAGTAPPPAIRPTLAGFRDFEQSAANAGSARVA